MFLEHYQLTFLSFQSFLIVICLERAVQGRGRGRGGVRGQQWNNRNPPPGPAHDQVAKNDVPQDKYRLLLEVIVS